jgi:hypothetical protein
MNAVVPNFRDMSFSDWQSRFGGSPSAAFASFGKDGTSNVRFVFVA